MPLGGKSRADAASGGKQMLLASRRALIPGACVTAGTPFASARVPSACPSTAGFSVLMIASSHTPRLALPFDVRSGCSAMDEVVQELNWLAGCTQQIVWLADLDPGSLLYASDGFDALWGLRKQDLLADPLRWHD